LVKKIDARGKVVLLIPDLHAPYHYRKLYKFLRYLKKKYKPDIIIFLGDEVDGHSWSFHSHDPDLPSPGDELRKAIKVLQKVYKIFPNASLLHSNHGSLLNRKTKANGLPLEILRPLRDLYKTPNWSWWDRIVLTTKIGKTMIVHGMSGKPGALALEMGMSTIEGHYHTKFHITWYINAVRRYYSVHSGCLIDFDSFAFAYARSNLKDPCLGATIIDKSGHPHLVPVTEAE
jgi:hypothetical protein